MTTRKYLAICRNYFYSNYPPYVLVESKPGMNKNEFISYVYSLRFEAFKILSLKQEKELKLYATYSPIHVLSAIESM